MDLFNASAGKGKQEKKTSKSTGKPKSAPKEKKPSPKEPVPVKIEEDESASDSDSDVRMQTTLQAGTTSRPKSDTLPTHATFNKEALRQQEDAALEAGEHGGKRTGGSNWSDAETQLMLIGLFNGKSVDWICEHWPQHRFKRSNPKSLRTRVETVQTKLIDIGVKNKDNNPETNGLFIVYSAIFLTLRCQCLETHRACAAYVQR